MLKPLVQPPCGTVARGMNRANLSHTEFKEIRKEWKAKKKEEDNLRKQDEERQRQEAGRAAQDGTPTQPPSAQYPAQHMMPPAMSSTQLPPIGYAPAGAQAPQQYAGQPQQVDGAQQYPPGQIYANGGYPQSPYGQSGPMYQQRQ